MANLERLSQLRKRVQKESVAVPEETSAAELSAVAEEVGTEPVAQPDQPVVDRERLGWISPKYSVSRSVTLSPESVTANRGIAFAGEGMTLDAYKILRTQILQRIKQEGGNTIMVTSAVAGEGKTTTAINLAFVLAKEFQQTVLLVDCDLQQQQVHKYLGYDSDGGLIDYLLDDRPVAELITWPGIEKITIISGGRTIRESSELLGSPRMKELIEDMKSRYPGRFIIFDVQPITTGADALVFAPLADHVLMVVAEGKTSVQDVKRAAGMLPAGKLLGLLLNRHRQGQVV